MMYIAILYKPHAHTPNIIMCTLYAYYCINIAYLN